MMTVLSMPAFLMVVLGITLSNIDPALALDTVASAQLTYVSPADSYTVYRKEDWTVDRERSSDVQSEQVPVIVRSGRGKNFSLAQHGFELVPHRTKVINFSNDEEVRRVYFEEIRTLLKKRLGCSHAFLTQHRQRSSELAVPKYVSGEDVDRSKTISIAPLVHADASKLTVGTFYRQLLQFFQEAYGKEDPATLERLAKLQRRTGGYSNAEVKMQLAAANELLKGKARLAYVVAWRNSDAHPIEQASLAVLDKSSVRREDRVPINFVLPVAQSDNLQTHHQWRLTGKNAHEHRWYYFPGMTREELLIMQAGDESSDDAVTFHTALPKEQGKRARTSVEIRALCFLPSRPSNDVS